MFQKVKKVRTSRTHMSVVATERFERMDILSSQNTESVNDLLQKRQLSRLSLILFIFDESFITGLIETVSLISLFIQQKYIKI